MAKLTTEDLLTREGRIRFLAAIAADDGGTVGAMNVEPTGIDDEGEIIVSVVPLATTTSYFTYDQRMRALELLMAVEGDQMIEVPYDSSDEYDDVEDFD